MTTLSSRKTCREASESGFLPCGWARQAQQTSSPPRSPEIPCTKRAQIRFPRSESSVRTCCRALDQPQRVPVSHSGVPALALARPKAATQREAHRQTLPWSAYLQELLPPEHPTAPAAPHVARLPAVAAAIYMVGEVAEPQSAASEPHSMPARPCALGRRRCHAAPPYQERRPSLRRCRRASVGEWNRAAPAAFHPHPG